MLVSKTGSEEGKWYVVEGEFAVTNRIVTSASGIGGGTEAFSHGMIQIDGNLIEFVSGTTAEDAIPVTKEGYSRTRDTYVRIKVGEPVPPEVYTVTWKLDDTSVIDTTEVSEGEMPVHADAEKPVISLQAGHRRLLRQRGISPIRQSCMSFRKVQPRRSTKSLKAPMGNGPRAAAAASRLHPTRRLKSSSA